MNERIDKLLVKAGAYFGGEGVDYSNFDPKKFAELIVFECVHAVMDGSKEGDWYAQKIEEHFDNGQGGILHFGVEE